MREKLPRNSYKRGITSFLNSWCKYERGKRRRKVTFEEETAVVEIDEEDRDYGATDKVT